MTESTPEFKKIYDRIIKEAKTPLSLGYHEATFQYMWLAYLMGRDDRPVVAPVYVDEYNYKCSCGSYAVRKCVDCYNNPDRFNYCGGCGAKLDWSSIS